MLRKAVAIIAVLFAAMIAPALAQSSLRTVPLGFCTLSSMSASTSLTTCSGGIPAGTAYAAICAVTQGVNWRDDGVAPTGSAGGGIPISAGSCMGYNATFTAILFIQQTSGAILTVSFYR